MSRYFSMLSLSLSRTGKKWAATWGRLYKNAETCPMNAVGADDFGGPLRGLCDSRAHPHSPRMRSAPSPWKGEGLGAAQCAAPTVGNGPGVLVRQTQAQKWSRTRSNFPQTQGPVARREFRHSLRFCASEMFCLTKGVTPVMGVLGPTPTVRGRCRAATEGVGWANMDTKCPS